MASVVDICNMALERVGGNRIDDIDAGDSVEALACKDHYETAVSAVIETTEFAFATKRVSLSASTTPPAFEYSYMFSIPNDCVRVLTVSDREDFANDFHWEREGDYILANSNSIYVRYLGLILDPLKYPGLFTRALSVFLASCLAIPIAHSPKLQATTLQEFREFLELAGNSDSMQGKARNFQNFQLINVR